MIVVLFCLLSVGWAQVSEDEVRSALCQGKPAGEYFRLVPGDKHCRDVVACADDGLKALRCPPELVFDVDRQTCDWRKQVNNCNIKSKPRKALPLLNTPEPLCGPNQLACGDTTCLPRGNFCDGVEDCADASDENFCELGQDPNGARKCDPSECFLPDCFCSEDAKEIPGGHSPESIPQMIILSFDDAVNNNNFPVYESIFKGSRVNPNGCSIKGTFFINNQFTNYSMVEALANAGNEIATHSMTHNSDDEDYWTDGSKDQWASEFSDGRIALEHFAKLPSGSVLGARAPQLRVGGNRQFEAMQDSGFLYDSSMVARLQNPPLWPYNVYYSLPHDCYGDLQKCPTRSYNVWEMIINELDRRENPLEVDDVVGCVTLDGCNTITTASQLYNVLSHNFFRHYETNRAPMHVYLHAAWFQQNPDMLEAFLYWVDEVLSDHQDVYFLTYSQVLEWIQSPIKSAQVTQRTLPGWSSVCQPSGPLSSLMSCKKASNCKVNSPAHNGAPQRLHTCLQCPEVYPWLGNPIGELQEGTLI